jgi:hypothetical protein
MANKERGEVAVQIGQQSYTLCFSTNAIAEIEQVGDASIMVLMAQYVTEGRAATTRLMLWGALRKFHPEISLLEAQLKTGRTHQIVFHVLQGPLPMICSRPSALNSRAFSPSTAAM